MKFFCYLMKIVIIIESKKVQAKDWAKDDYYDSDDDLYLDRTGLIEKKRYKRMKSVQGAETFESLVSSSICFFKKSKIF